MTAKERYDAIISKIEEEVREPEKKVNDIIQDVMAACGSTERDLNSVMNFLTHHTLRKYIKNRRMMAIYQHFLSSDPFDIEDAIEWSDYDNQSSFTKQFTEIFSISPKSAFESKNVSLYELPLTWDRISDQETMTVHAEKTLQPEENNNFFGIPREQYEKIREAAELQDLYGLDDTYSQVAYEVADRRNVSLKDAFEYMESWRIFIQEDYTVVDPVLASCWLPDKTKSRGDSDDFMKNLRERCAFNETIQYLFFECDLSVTLSITTVGRLAGRNEDLREIPPFFAYDYAHTPNFDFRIYKESCQYFMNHLKNRKFNEEAFERYITLICLGDTKEEAFSEAETIIILDDEWDSDEGDEFIDFELIEEEEINRFAPLAADREQDEIDRWNKEPPIDQEYDPDNPDWYDQDDWTFRDEDERNAEEWEWDDEEDPSDED